MCGLVLSMSVSLQIALKQLEEFNARNFDLLFAEFYHPQLEVYEHTNFNQLRELMITLNDPNLQSSEKDMAIASAIAGYDKNLFPDLEVLRGHVKKQFASSLEMHVKVLEQAAHGNYAVLFERKKRDGLIVDAVDIYYIEDGMIRKMWIAKTQ